MTHANIRLNERELNDLLDIMHLHQKGLVGHPIKLKRRRLSASDKREAVMEVNVDGICKRAYQEWQDQNEEPEAHPPIKSCETCGKNYVDDDLPLECENSHCSMLWEV